MIARMRVIADSEGIGIADEALAAIAYRADGGLRDALTMLEQVAAFAGAGAGSSVVVGPEAGSTLPSARAVGITRARWSPPSTPATRPRR